MSGSKPSSEKSSERNRSEKFEADLKTRKAVLGDAYVDASITALKKKYAKPYYKALFIAVCLPLSTPFVVPKKC